MREIKFRGKRLDDGVWVYGGLITDNKGNYGIAQLILLNNCVTSAVRLIDPATVGQLTGFIDKDGKEIYEGDIVERKIERSDYYPAITMGGVPEHKETKRWIEKEVRAISMNPEIRYGHTLMCGKLLTQAEVVSGRLFATDYDYAVIGNIHDNPELIKTK